MKRIGSSSKLITISTVILIALLYFYSSFIYAKEDPSNIRNQPHDFNKFVCGTRADHSLHSQAILIHAENLKRISDLQLTPSVTADFDEGDVSVMVDDGTLISSPAANPVDLDGLTFLYTPNVGGGYNVDTVAFTFDLSFGDDVGAGNTTNHEFNLTGGFSFPYFDTIWTNIWVRSNGNVTFGAIGIRNFFPTDFSVELPIIAPFFGDLDPSAGGAVFVKEESTKFTVTWNALPERGVSNSNTIQLVLNNDGSFQITYNGLDMVTPANGTLIVGFNSGRAGATVKAVDFSAVPIDGGSNDILFELFKSSDSDPHLTVDAIALFNKFYETHDDIFDQVVLLTNFASVSGAFNSGIRNSVQGINIPTFNFSANYGSAGRLQSYLNLNELNYWFDNPFRRRGSDGNSFLTVMGQEAGHRWLSFLRFDPGTGVSDLILGRSLVHWSTFLKFELTSTMDGGNNWVEISPNTYENQSWIDYFSNLDQYAMGLRAPEEVPPFYYISSATNNTLSARTPGTVTPGARASGTRVDVTIEEVIAAEGARIPARDSSQKDFQQAFILLVQQGTLPSDAELNKAKRFVAAWKDYWVVATDGRSTMSTNLDTVLDVAVVEGIVADASTNQPIENITALNLDTGVKQTVAAGGYYTWRTLADSVGEPDGSFTQVISAYPYFPDTLVVPVTFNSTIGKNISLTKLPIGSLAGIITNSNSGASVEALLVLHVSSDASGAFDIEVSTDGSGGYSFADLFVTYPGVVSYKGITVYPDFPNVATEFGEIIVEAGITTTANIGVETADVLLVNDDPSGNYPEFYARVFDSLQVTYREWRSLDKGAVPAQLTNQLGYPIIVWFTGNETVNSISAAEEDSLRAFLDAGGRLFLTGQNIVETLSPTSTLLTDYLHVSHGGNSTRSSVSGISGSPLQFGSDRFSINIGGDGAGNQDSPDILIPTGAAAEALTYKTGPDVAAVSVDDGIYKIFLTGFGFEGVNSGSAGFAVKSSSEQLMFRVLTWFGIPGLVSVDDEVIATLPKKFELEQNYPNPFNASTSINYTLSQDSKVRVSIYNMLGQKVKTLVDADKRSGRYTVEWNGLTETGRQVASGLYFYRLEAGHEKDGRAHMYVDVKKMILLR